MKEDFDNTFEEYSEDSFAENDPLYGGEFIAEKISIPQTADTVKDTKNNGIRIFALILAAVLTVSLSVFGGYYLGVHSTSERHKSGVNSYISLQSKPAKPTVYSADKIYADTVESVVGILVYNKKGDSGEATGVVLSEDGYIITNDHIYTEIPSAKFKIYMHDGTEYNAYFVAGDTRSDIAVLKIRENVKLKVPTFGNSSSVVSGESVCAIGCPNGYSSKATITVGIVSVPKVRKTITSIYSSNFIQTDTAINPGNSGGALVNVYGQIIGITSAKISDTSYEGVGFAIPTNTVKRITESLIENGNVKDRARLGIQYRFYNSANAEVHDLATGGLLVTTVLEDSDLYGKLNVNDMIVKVNELEITNDSIILDVLEEHVPGDTINLTVLRENGKTEVITALLLSDEGSSSYTIAKG